MAAARSTVAVDDSGGLDKMGSGGQRSALAHATSAGTISVANLARRGASGNNRLDCVSAQASCTGRCPQPFGMRPCDRFDVRGKRRIERQMRRGMLADEVDDGHVCPAGIVQICETVGEDQGRDAGECMAGFSAMARIAVRGAGDHTFEQAE